MAYDSSVSGTITVTPPIPWSQIKDSPFLPDVAWMNDKAVKLRVVETPEDTPDGVLLRRHADGIVPVTTDLYDGYTLVEDVEAIVAAHPNRTYTGWLVRDGDDRGDLSRVGVIDGRVVQQDARIVWPDGSDGL